MRERIENQSPRPNDWRTHEYIVRSEVREAGQSGTIAYAEGVALESRMVETRPNVYTPQVVSIVPSTEEDTWAWREDVVAALAEIVADFPIDGEGTARRFEGYLSFEGEENGDLWRTYIIDGKPVIVEAEIVWPDPYQKGT